MSSTTTSTPRAIKDVFLAEEQSEGQGARVRRSIGGKLRNFTPFLLLDHFSVSPPAGFPDHPHSGQETITYMLNGYVDHEDFTGSAGTIGPGDLQFMTAGKGIAHAEMPRASDDGSPATGLQLWVDLEASKKQCEPRYRDLKASEIPVIKPSEKVEIKIISGESHGTESVKELSYTDVKFYDITIQPGGKVRQGLPSGYSGFAYVMKGNVVIGEGEGGRKVDEYHLAVFEDEGDAVDIEVKDSEGGEARLVLIAGQQHKQGIVQMGPFVGTSRADIMRIVNNYQSQSNGFERLNGWKSKIGERAY